MSPHTTVTRTLLAFATCLGSLTAGDPATGEWSDVFDLPGLSGRAFALHDWNGQVVAGGQTFRADGHTLQHIATFDGLVWEPLGNGLTGDVRDMTTFEGDLIAGGWFHVAGGTVPQGGVIANGVARWDGASWSPLGEGLDLSWSFNPEIWAVEVYRGELYAGGLFDNTDGVPIEGIARWDGVNWVPVADGISGGQYAKVLDMHVTSDDRLIVAGEFELAGGQPAFNIATWDGTSWSSLGTGVDLNFASVFAVEEHAGKIYIAGTFGDFVGDGTRKIAAWDGTSWEAVGNGIPDWDISVTAYALESFQGDLYVGGNFNGIDGLPCSRIAKWTGTEWQSIGGVSGQDLKTTVLALHAFDNVLYVGGEFTRSGLIPVGAAATVSNDVVGFDGSDWVQTSHGLGFDIEVYDLVHWNGGIVAVGRFIEAGGSQASRVAFFDGTDWTGLGSTNGNVQEALVFEGDLIITGDFTSVAGLQTGATARYDGVTWSALGNGSGGAALGIYDGQLYAGGLGGTKRWNGTAWENFGEQTFGIVECLQEYAGKLYIGGSFGAFGGPGKNITSWDGSVMAPLGAGTNDIVEQMTVHDGKLLVGGRFMEVDGMPARIMATWDGTSWEAFDTGITGFSVEAFAHLNGELYAGGDLLYGIPGGADYVARWDGTSWHALDDGVGGYVFTLLADEINGQLWVGGWFYSASGSPSWNVARWDVQATAPGEQWRDMSRGLRGGEGLTALRAWGEMMGDDAFGLEVTGAPPRAPSVLIAGFEPAMLPFHHGVLVPQPDIVVPVLTDSHGRIQLTTTWPALVPAGLELLLQVWTADTASATGASASNALRATTP